MRRQYFLNKARDCIHDKKQAHNPGTEFGKRTGIKRKHSETEDPEPIAVDDDDNTMTHKETLHMECSKSDNRHATPPHGQGHKMPL